MSGEAEAPRGAIASARRRLHAYGARLLDAHTDPGRLAAAALVGAVVGCTPLFGLHLPICIALAWLLRLNQVTVYAAANVSIPPLVPVLGFASIQAGSLLRHRVLAPLTPAALRGVSPRALAADLALDWLLGGIVVGVAVGAVMAAAVYTLARRRQRLAGDPVRRAIRDASRRYRAAPRPMRGYAWFKYRLDPCYRLIAGRVPEGALTVDLGTGLGMLPLVLALVGGGRRAVGVEWDAAKLAAGRAAAADLDTISLIEGDVRDVDIPPCDVVTLVDVLHYFDDDAQRALLARCAAALRPGGRLLVRDGDLAASRTARWTRLVESVAVRLGWNRADRTRFRPASALESDLRALGLTVTTAEASGPLHPGNRLTEAARPPAGPDAPA